MVLPHGTGDLYHKYRPRRFSELIGHSEMVKSIKSAIFNKNRAHAFLLTGVSGTGKTSTSRIMALALNCTSLDKALEPCLKCDSCKAIIARNCIDIIEVNAADSRGIDDVRQLCSGIIRSPMHVKNKVFILDECHQLSAAAQASLLKELEEAPNHAYMILCSTHPQKIIATVKNRCQKFVFKPLPPPDMRELIEQVSILEGHVLSKDIIHLITSYSEGSPRKGLVNLQQTLQLENINKENIVSLFDGEETEDKGAIELCFALDRAPNWKNICTKYKECAHIGPPAIGMIIAGYFRNKLLKSSDFLKAKRYHTILDVFKDPIEEGKLGENKLVSMLYKSVESVCNKNAPKRF
jgi:DNA polymerase-3 subunit gamma/tau